MQLWRGFVGAISGALFGLIATFALDSQASLGMLGMGFIAPIALLFGLLAGIILVRRAQSSACRRGRAIGYWIALAALIGVIYLNNTPPSDRELIAHFQADRVVFDKLLHTAQDHPEYTASSKGAALPEDFLRLLRRAQVLYILISKDGSAVHWVVWSSNGAVLRRKGYAYLVHPPSQLFSSLDSIDFPPQHRVYRAVHGDWYLFYDSIPDG